MGRASRSKAERHPLPRCLHCRARFEPGPPDPHGPRLWCSRCVRAARQVTWDNWDEAERRWLACYPVEETRRSLDLLLDGE